MPGTITGMASEFWDRVRLTAKAVSSVFNGKPLTAPAHEATQLQRAISTGHAPGQSITQNYWENLRHMSSWSFPAIDAFATQIEGSSISLYSKAKQVNKSHGPSDAPAPARTPIHDHELLDLMENPNPVFWREIWLYHIACQYALTGGWVIWEVRGKETNKPTEYWTLPRSWLTFMPPQKNYPMGVVRVFNPAGASGYWGDNPLANGFYLDVRECIIGGRPDPQRPAEPLSTMSQMSRVIDICEQADTAVWTSLLESPRPGMVLLVDDKFMMDDTQMKRIRETVSANNAGTNNAGKLMILQGMKLDRQGSSVGDLDAVNVRDQNMKMVLAAHSTPSIAIGARNEVGSYSGNAAEINTWIELHVQPFLNRFYGCLNHRNRRYWPDVKLEGNANRFDDPTLDMQKRDQYLNGYDKGIFTLDQVLAVFDEPPAGPGIGDQRKAQPDPNAGMMGPDGMPLDPNAMDPNAAGGDDMGLDLELDDLPDDEAPNMARPDLSRAGGRSFAVNGNGRGH